MGYGHLWITDDLIVGLRFRHSPRIHKIDAYYFATPLASYRFITIDLHRESVSLRVCAPRCRLELVLYASRTRFVVTSRRICEVWRIRLRSEWSVNQVAHFFSNRVSFLFY